MAWHPPFIQWSPGTQAAVDLNVPDRFVREALWYGAGTALVYGEPVTESSWAATGWQRFLEYVERVKVMTGTHTERAESVNQSHSQRQPTLLAERRLRLQKG